MLIEFTLIESKAKVWINPAYVVHVQDVDEGHVAIYDATTDKECYEVEGTAAEIAAKLNAAEKESRNA